MSKKVIAIIYEGEKTEKLLLRNLSKRFFMGYAELVPIMFPAGENIYMLWKQLKEDDFETDVIEVVRDSSESARKILSNFKRNDFMEIYLFFDYDGHNQNLNKSENGNEVLKEMLDTFSDETNLGKLYINYPMTESIRDITRDDCCYRRCVLEIAELCRYKQIVHEMKDYQDSRKYSVQDWSLFCLTAVKKWNCIVNNRYIVPEREEYLKVEPQKRLFENQLQKFVVNEKIAIINGFPLFLLEYFKKEFWDRMLGT